MKIALKALTLAAILALCLSFISCDFDESKNHLSGGELLDDERLSEIKNEVFSGEESTEKESAETVTSTTSEPDTDDTGIIVYWTESGSVWHKSASCSHIKNSTNLLAGTVTQAKNAGKSNPCSRCFD